jgi:hypothetical protein
MTTTPHRRGCLYFFKRGLLALVLLIVAGAVYQVRDGK